MDRIHKSDADIKISVILPIYNTKLYLPKCIESLLNQTYKNIEVIGIDDGSTDGSELILDKYAKEDSRIKVIHKENGGESSARNAGLRAMSGQYVGFMDCDDWIESDMYEKLLSHIINNQVDIVASSWYCDRANSSEKIQNRLPVLEEAFGRDKLLNYLYKRDDYRGFAYMWNKLYRRELFYDTNHILMTFDEDLMLGGDVLYLGKLAMNAKSAFYCREAFYHYNQRETSGCHTENLAKREDWLEAYRRLIVYIENAQSEINILPWIKRFMVYHSSNVAEMAYGQGNREVLGHCQKIMAQYREEYLTTNQQYPDRTERYKKILEYAL